MKVWTVNYKLNNPVVYNKGTKYEKTEDTFFESFASSEEVAQNKVNELNKTITDRQYFISRQEVF